METGSGESAADFIDVCKVARLHRHAQIAAVDIRTFVGMLMVDSGDIAAAGSNDAGDTEQLSGLVHKLDRELAAATGHKETAGDDAGEDGDVDIAAGENAGDFFSAHGDFPEHDGGGSDGAGTFGNELMLFHECKDGGGNFIIADRDNLIDEVAADVVGKIAGLLDGDTVGNGADLIERFDLSVCERLLHAGGAGSLYAVDLDFGIEAFHGEGDAGDQPAAADRNNNGIESGKLIHEFQTDGPLSGNDSLIVEGVQEGIPLFVAELQRASIGVVIDARNEADLGTVTFGGLDFGNGSAIGQTDDGLDSVFLRSKGDTLCMVSCGCGNQTFSSFFFRKGADLVVCATDFICAGTLHILWFKENLVSCQF